jgi:hypothetical protein
VAASPRAVGVDGRPASRPGKPAGTGDTRKTARRQRAQIFVPLPEGHQELKTADARDPLVAEDDVEFLLAQAVEGFASRLTWKNGPRVAVTEMPVSGSARHGEGECRTSRAGRGGAAPR